MFIQSLFHARNKILGSISYRIIEPNTLYSCKWSDKEDHRVKILKGLLGKGNSDYILLIASNIVKNQYNRQNYKAFNC